MRIIYYPVPLVFVLLLLAACSQKQPKETPYIDRAEELFQSVWSKYRAFRILRFSLRRPTVSGCMR